MVEVGGGRPDVVRLLHSDAARGDQLAVRPGSVDQGTLGGLSKWGGFRGISNSRCIGWLLGLALGRLWDRRSESNRWRRDQRLRSPRSQVCGRVSGDDAVDGQPVALFLGGK